MEERDLMSDKYLDIKIIHDYLRPRFTKKRKATGGSKGYIWLDDPRICRDFAYFHYSKLRDKYDIGILELSVILYDKEGNLLKIKTGSKFHPIGYGHLVPVYFVGEGHLISDIYDMYLYKSYEEYTDMYYKNFKKYNDLKGRIPKFSYRLCHDDEINDYIIDNVSKLSLHDVTFYEFYYSDQNKEYRVKHNGYSIYEDWIKLMRDEVLSSRDSKSRKEMWSLIKFEGEE